jgi:hypothetical protein
MRARLLKQNFRMAVQSLPPTEQNKTIIVKFGEWHLYRGFNPLHHLDLGNYIAEHADVDGKQSLSICVLGAKGVHRAYGKYGQQSTTEPFSSIDDRWYHWMAPVIAGQLPNSWTLYDLRKLRFQNLAGIDPDLARVIDGYDLLVVIPELTPAIERGCWPDITGALGVNVVERWVLEMRAKKEGRPEGRPNAALKRLEQELAGEDHIANSGSESGDRASLGWRVEEVIQAAEVGVTQIGTRRSIV